MSFSKSAFTATKEERFNDDPAQVDRFLERIRAKLQAEKKLGDVYKNGRSLVEAYDLHLRDGSIKHVAIWNLPKQISEPRPAMHLSPEQFLAAHKVWKAANETKNAEHDAWLEVDKAAAQIITTYYSEACELKIGADYEDARDLWLKVLDFYDGSARKAATAAEHRRRAAIKMKDSDTFIQYYTAVMPHIIKVFCPTGVDPIEGAENENVRSQLFDNLSQVKRLSPTVSHCRVSNATTTQCYDLLGLADARDRPSLSTVDRGIGAIFNDAVLEPSLCALTKEDIACWNCGSKHIGDCSAPCRFCAGKSHEIMDCVKFRKHLGKKNSVPLNYVTSLGKRKLEDNAPSGWYSTRKGKLDKGNAKMLQDRAPALKPALDKTSAKIAALVKREKVGEFNETS